MAVSIVALFPSIDPASCGVKSHFEGNDGRRVNQAMGDAPEIGRRTEELTETILRLLDQQRVNLGNWPYTLEQLDKDREISARLRRICDQLPTPRIVVNRSVVK
jgi:hypothetical protein